MEAIKIEGYGSVQTAELLGISKRTLERYIASGKIKGTKIANRWFFTQEEIDRVKALKTTTD